MSAIEDITDTEFDKVLEQVQSGECDVDSRIDERQDMSEELFVVVSAPVDDTCTLSMSGMAPRDERC